MKEINGLLEGFNKVVTDSKEITTQIKVRHTLVNSVYSILEHYTQSSRICENFESSLLCSIPLGRN